jgi:hypothetical protein
MGYRYHYRDISPTTHAQNPIYNMGPVQATLDILLEIPLHFYYIISVAEST